MKEVKITFKAEVYVEGVDMAEIRANWEYLPLFSADALEYASPNILEVESVEDTETNEDLKKEFNEAEYE